jgi:hypothetical protein
MTFDEFVDTVEASRHSRMDESLTVELLRNGPVAKWRRGRLWCRVTLTNEHVVESVLGAEDAAIASTPRPWFLIQLDALQLAEEISSYLRLKAGADSGPAGNL